MNPSRGAPTWLLPVILLCIAESAIVGVYGHRIGWRSLIEKTADQ